MEHFTFNNIKQNKPELNIENIAVSGVSRYGIKGKVAVVGVKK
ncbi:MAG: hypothetical protein SWZ49_23335 [Cyanobacteriota bacterium]|nr:hypothetical protein [Cyanobacteriota bacterium]